MFGQKYKCAIDQNCILKYFAHMWILYTFVLQSKQTFDLQNFEQSSLLLCIFIEMHFMRDFLEKLTELTNKKLIFFFHLFLFLNHDKYNFIIFI